MTRTAAERERLVFAARVSFLFAALAAVIGTNMPFLPVWLDWAGLTPSEIAIVTATPLLVRVAVTPAIAFAADRAGDHRTFLIGLAWLGLAGLLALAQSRGFWPILVFTIVFSLSWTTNMPLAETVAMSGVKAAGLDYGRMRLWGSLSFIAASLAGGWVIQVLGAASAIWLIVAASLLVVAAAQALPPPIGQGRLRAATGPPRLSLADATGLVRSRIFLIFLAAGGLTSASHAVLYTFGTLHWRAQGLSTGWSGTLWAISIVAEVALFAWSAAAVARAGPVGLVALGAGASLLRWLVMGLDPPLAVLVPLQLLHAATFGATHIGAIHFIGRTVPETQAGTAQALYASVTGGIAMGAAMLAAGPLYAAYAGGAYWAMAVLAGAGLAASLVLLRARP
ncbi:MAG TPA: MFS transporter [Hyphomicrobiaceae bacterium]|nr:MFS transporter [Hyphomicrobiaceae bacterium]